jgi:hypothetical protein
MDMSKHAGDNATRIIQALDLMLAPEGVTITALMERLGLTRRSACRLLKFMEQDLRLPIVSGYETCGDQSVYRLSPPYAEKLLRITIDLTLDFQQALFVYTLLCRSGIPAPAIMDKIVNALDLPNTPA